MADLQTAPAASNKRAGPVRARRMSTRIDFTPMVDLGFLLITFFMLTTVLNKPQIMPMAMPETENLTNPPEVKNSQVLTLLLGADNKVYWYEGIENARLDSTNYAAEGLRRVILDKKARVRQEWGDEVKSDAKRPGQTKTLSRLTVIIKPTKASRYKNVVDVFDEMKICDVSRYMMLDISNQEEAFIHNPSAGLRLDAPLTVAAGHR